LIENSGRIGYPYDLDEEKHGKIVQDLKQKHEEKEIKCPLKFFPSAKRKSSFADKVRSSVIGVAKTKAEPGIDLVDVDVPEPDDHFLLVKVDTVGICGSDVHIYEWTPGYEFMQDNFPIIIGHEMSGMVVECGRATSGRLKKGDRVTYGVSPSCGICRFCKNGQIIYCEKRVIAGRTGLDHNGAMAEYFTAREENLYRLPENVSFLEAAMTEPAAVSLGAVQLARWIPGDTVLVMGPGPIGLIIVQLCKLFDAGRILVAGLSTDTRRLETACQMGADETVMVDKCGFEGIRKAVGPNGADAVFEASGSVKAASHGLEVLRKGGDLILAGIYTRPIPFDATHHIVRQMKSIKGSYAGPRSDKVLDLLARGELDLKPLASEILPLSDAGHGFEMARDTNNLKILMRPDTD
jgi:threonine dehydrogenase-like Zn-dependent dehydrogenase